MKKLLKISFGFFSFILFLAFSFKHSATAPVYADIDSVTLTTYLNQQEDIINELIDDTYSTLYDQIQNTGQNLKNTLNYRSLECLGVIKFSDSISTESLQKDIDNIRAVLSKDFASLRSEISTASASAQPQLLTEIINTVNKHKGVVSAFEKMYNNKITLLSQDIIDYTAQNSDIVGYVNDKIYKLDHIKESIKMLTDNINKINSLIIGNNADFFDSFSGVRASFINMLNLKLQPLIDNAVSKYKAVPGLSGALYAEKEFAIRMYGLDFDEKLNTILDQRYNKTDYDYIKNQITTIQNQYTTDNQLDCIKIFSDSASFDLIINNLIAKLDSMLIQIKTDNITSASASQIKYDLVSTFATFNNININNKTNDFKKIILNKVSQLLHTQSPNSLTTQSVNSLTLQPVNKISFTRPFKKGEKSTAVETLQQLLKTNGYYNGDINGINTKQTIEAIYKFQLKNGLLKGYENRIATRGWLGPATRAKLNELIGLGGLDTIITNMAYSTGDFVVGYEATTTTSTTYGGGVVSGATSNIIIGSTNISGMVIIGTTITTGSVYVTGSTTITNINPVTQSDLFYQTMINDIIKPYTGNQQKEALQQAFIKTTLSINNTANPTIIQFLQGFKFALQMYLNAMQ